MRCGAHVTARALIAPRRGASYRAGYEHPYVVRLCHWLTALSLPILAASGLGILRAFPSFGDKVPQHDFITVPDALALGGWLGGALQWHLTFMWLFAAAGAVYVCYQLASGHYRQVLFTPSAAPGVWPMARYYLRLGPKPPPSGDYNPLQQLAYTIAIALSAMALVSGLALWKPVQLGWLVWLLGGFRLVRVWHFAAMCGLLAFVPGHLMMVALHGWNNTRSMFTGWKRVGPAE